MQNSQISNSSAKSVSIQQRIGQIALWLLQILMAFMLGSSGLMKLAGAPEMLDLFNNIGAGQWLRFVVGIAELIGAIGLLIPRFAGLAAILLGTVMLGASITNLFILQVSPAFTIVLLLLNAIIAWRRWPQTKALLNLGS